MHKKKLKIRLSFLIWLLINASIVITLCYFYFVLCLLEEKNNYTQISFGVVKQSLIISGVISFFFATILMLVFTIFIDDIMHKFSFNFSKFGINSSKITFDDISIREFSDLEEELYKINNKVIEDNKVENDFINGIVHEIKSPLTIIKSYAEMIRDFDDDKEIVNQNLDIIISQANILNDHINDLQLISRVKSDYYKKDTINASEILDEVLNDYDLTIKKEGIDLELDITHLYVRGNSLCLKYCFSNYISNAIKYCNNKVKIFFYKQSDCVVFEVLNDGNRIEEKDVDEIWNYYFRINSDTEGSGIGLAVVRSICEYFKYKYSYEFIDNYNKFSIIIGDKDE